MSSQISSTTAMDNQKQNPGTQDRISPEEPEKAADDFPSKTGAINLKPIGRVRCCFAEKFGIPRQPALAEAARGQIEILPPYHQRQAWQGLEGFSHIWVLFWFHARSRSNWQPMVRPPRLGGNRKIGVFASRSGFRPNAIGMSAVRLERIEFQRRLTRLHVSGLDFMDKTPVLDIKPYLPWADQIPDATGGFAASCPQTRLAVSFNGRALAALAKLAPAYPGLPELLRQVIGLDPRPAYMQCRKEPRSFGMRIYDLEIKWQVAGDKAEVTGIYELPPATAASAGRVKPQTDGNRR